MPNIISNTSCLIIFDNIEMLPLLKNLYHTVYITEEVYEEFGKPVEDWIRVKLVNNVKYMHILNNIVDKGEASTIALSLEVDDSVMILDDNKARTLAKNLNLNFTGSLGVILKAKENHLIDSVAEVLKKIKSAGFRISSKMEKEVLRLAKE